MAPPPLQLSTLLIYPFKIELPFAGIIFHHPSPRVWGSKAAPVPSISCRAVPAPPLPHFSADTRCHQALGLGAVPWLPVPPFLQLLLRGDKTPLPCMSSAWVIYCSLLRNVLRSGCPSSLAPSTWDGTSCLSSPEPDSSPGCEMMGRSTGDRNWGAWRRGGSQSWERKIGVNCFIN